MSAKHNTTQSTTALSSKPPVGQLYYSILRVVPDPVRGEFVNTGIIVTDMESRTIIRWANSECRARLLTKNRAILNAITSYIKDFEQMVSSQQFVSKEWLREQHEMRNNLIQLSFPAPIAPMSIEAASDLIFNRFVD